MITLPNGVRFRSASARRYVLVVTFDGDATTLKRSDTLATVEAEYRRRPDTVESGDGRRRSHFIVDRVAGTVLRQRGEDEFRFTR